MKDNSPSKMKRRKVDPDQQLRDVAQNNGVPFQFLKKMQTQTATMLTAKDDTHKAEIEVLEAKLAAADAKSRATEQKYKNEVVELEGELQEQSVIYTAQLRQIQLQQQGKQIQIDTIAMQKEEIEKFIEREKHANKLVMRARAKMVKLKESNKQLNEQLANSAAEKQLEEEVHRNRELEWDNELIAMRAQERAQTRELKEEKRKRGEIEHVRCTLCLKRPVDTVMLRCAHVMSCWQCYETSLRAAGSWRDNCMKCRAPHGGRAVKLTYN